MFDIDPEKCVPLGTTLNDVAVADIVFVAVPTPSKKDGTCHTDIVVSVVKELKKANEAVNIVIRSTVPPGTSKSLGVSFMPEFLTEANANIDFCNNPLWILGDGDSTKLQQLLTNAKAENIIVSDKLVQMSSTEAEMVKYVRNCFLSVPFLTKFLMLVGLAGVISSLFVALSVRTIYGSYVCARSRWFAWIWWSLFP